MTRVGKAVVAPLHAQVLFTTSPDAEHPQWITGEEAAVASATAIAVATAPDLDGASPRTVAVEVLIDEPPSEGTLVFRGRLLVSSWGVAVGDAVSTKQHRYVAAAGEYEAAIYVDPATTPSPVWLSLTRT